MFIPLSAAADPRPAQCRSFFDIKIPEGLLGAASRQRSRQFLLTGTTHVPSESRINGSLRKEVNVMKNVIEIFEGLDLIDFDPDSERITRGSLADNNCNGC